MSDVTIFDRILDGAIPCHRVYEDDAVLAFLDVGPLSFGHVLVIPKQRVAFMHELDDDVAAGLGRVLPRLCRAMMTVTGASSYNVLQNNGAAANQAVFHVHVHIIPRYEDGREQAGLGLQWNAGALDAADAASLADGFAKALS